MRKTLEYENQQVKQFEKSIDSIQLQTAKRGTVVYKIIAAYLLLTLTNILILWLFIGSRQLKIISEKALLQARDHIEVIVDAIQKKFPPGTAVSNSNFQIVASEFKKDLEKKKLFLEPGYRIITTDEKLLYADDKSLKKVSAEDLRGALKAVHVQELNHKSFWARSNLSAGSITAYAPLFNEAEKSTVLVLPLSMNSITQEVNSLVYVALFCLALMLLAQTLFGIFVYRLIVIPIWKMTSMVSQLAEGKEVEDDEKQSKRKDDFGYLFRSFIQMTNGLKSARVQLQSMVDKLNQRNQVLENELDMAMNVQNGILPSDLNCNLFSGSAYYRPLEKVSGDFYDVLRLNKTNEAFFIADISGHGVPAALITIMAKMKLLESSKLKKPTEILAEMNKSLPDELLHDHYLTAFCLSITKSRMLYFSNAGHVWPLLVRKKDQEIIYLDTQGMPVGVIDEHHFKGRRLQLAKGDRIFLFTDGITETRNAANEMYDTRIEKVIKRWNNKKPVEEVVDRVIKDIDKFRGKTPMDDDLTLVGLEIK